MAYDPTRTEDRAALATQIVATLDTAGFKMVRMSGTNEAVYTRSVAGTHGKVNVVVYTTVVRGALGQITRSCGWDSIKVCATYTGRGGKVQGLIRETRVHRVGELDAITGRMLERMRSVYRKALQTPRCSSCGAPKFTSKAGNLVCANICWKSDAEFTRTSNPRYRRSA